MTKLFFLTSELGDSDAAGALALLARALPRDRFEIAVGVLGSATGASADALRAAGVPVTALPIRNVLDFSGMRRLRRAVREFGAQVLHAFGPDAVRAARLCVTRRAEVCTPRLVATGAVEPGGGVAGWVAGRQLRRADRVITTGWAEGERYRRSGVSGDRLTRIAPAAEPPSEAPDRVEFGRQVGAPGGAKFIFAGGHLEPAHGMKDAVMAFDMLRYVSPALNLVLSAAGPARATAEDIGRALAFDDFRIRFAGSGGAALALAEQVWVLCARGAERLALAAMATGRPVVAYHTPDLAEIIDDGTTGYLVPAGDRAALATKAQMLLAYPENAARMGEAGRVRAAERFGLARFVEQHARVYQELV